MQAEEYINERLQKQIDWYDSKAIESQKRFERLRMTEIIAAAAIPFLSGATASISSFSTVGAIIMGLLGMAVTVIAGWLGVGQYQQRWIEYRTTCEGLKKEKFLYLAKTDPYSSDDSFSTLVQRVEMLLSKENFTWSQNAGKPEKGGAKPGKT
ncbi:MAG: DUF4231 domain-containing protein [Nitrospirales bacterium]|nr:DUF4231 domain-containing protein [Nitrospirales bacterium]